MKNYEACPQTRVSKKKTNKTKKKQIVEIQEDGALLSHGREWSKLENYVHSEELVWIIVHTEAA